MSSDKPAKTVRSRAAVFSLTSKTSMALCFCLIATIIALGGFVYYHSEATRIQKEKSSELAAIGKIKVDQILRWRKERINDITRIAKSAAVKHLLEEWLRRPDDAKLREALLERLRLETELDIYFQAILGNADEHILLSFPEIPLMETDCWDEIKTAWNNFEPVLSDLHRTTSGGIHENIAMAARDESGRPLAVIMLTTNAQEFLFPMIQAWPTSSRTAETLLVRREGNEVLFLNELRHRKNTALNMREPLSQTRLPAAQAVLGRTGAFLGQDYRGTEVFADLRPVPGTSWYLVSKEDASEILGEVRYRAVIIFVVVFILILGVAGLVIYLFQIRRLTELKQMDELKAVSFYSRNLIETSLDPLVTISPEGKITDVNTATEKITGVSRERLIGTNFSDYFTEPEKARAGYQKVFLAGQVMDYPLALRHTSGAITDVLYNASVYRDERGKVLGVFAAARDITERKKAEERIGKLNVKLSAAVKEMEAFSYSVAHDLKTPLRAMAGFVNILAEDYAPKLDENGRQMIGDITDNAKKMAQLIEDLLQLSHLGRKAMDLVDIDMTKLADSVCHELKAALFPDKAMEVSVKALPSARADLTLAKQIFTNLISNAIKFSAQKEKAVIEISAYETEEECIYYVKDNGAGFDMKYADKLFGIFQRLHSQDEFGGTGIGLAIVRSAVGRLGGRVWAEGEVGRGATFYFTLPKGG